MIFRHAHHRLMGSRSNSGIAVLPPVLRTPTPTSPYQHMPFLSVSIISSSSTTHVAGMASHLFHIYGIRKMVKPVQTGESSLKFMTRSLARMVDGKGVVFSYSSLYHFRRVGRLTLMHMGYRLCNWLGRRPDRCRILWPSPEVQDEKFVQVPHTDYRRCRPCVAG